MEYKIFANGNEPVIALRLDPGDEMIASILEVGEKENIQAATIGIMDLNAKEYKLTHYTEPFEITAIAGNLSRKDGKAYLHSHINLGGVDGVVKGGHLDRCVISVTAEIFIRVIDGAIHRTYHDGIGINQMIF